MCVSAAELESSDFIEKPLFCENVLQFKSIWSNSIKCNTIKIRFFYQTIWHNLNGFASVS